MRAINGGSMDRTAIAVLVLSVMATVTAMALPPSYPNASISVWRTVLLLGLTGMALASIYLGANMYSLRTWPVVTMALGILCFMIGAIWYALSSPQAPGKVSEQRVQQPINSEASNSTLPKGPIGVYFGPTARGNTFETLEITNATIGIVNKGEQNSFGKTKITAPPVKPDE